ncbi:MULTISPECIES: hypothetical protein [unclassified Curtobacterium]|uniref:hypothetical protein n=1 Tax=unclassified Curtobacterium TaxID=257496 RepID=UPI0015E8B3BD|nr:MULTISPECIES: hypothetical protein [unclassified Curtobacterium]MDY1005102.1 hypothetical protein [Curtobacterium sp. CFBP9011]WIE61463.1 hypothetical protein DEI97_017225 [Curtobacterium sp. MCLR17_032]
MFTTITPIATRIDPADVSLPPTRSISLGRCRRPPVPPRETLHHDDRRDGARG